MKNNIILINLIFFLYIKVIENFSNIVLILLSFNYYFYIKIFIII